MDQFEVSGKIFIENMIHMMRYMRINMYIVCIYSSIFYKFFSPTRLAPGRGHLSVPATALPLSNCDRTRHWDSLSGADVGRPDGTRSQNVSF